MRFQRALGLMETGIHSPLAQMAQMEINHPGAAPGTAGLQAHISAIEMKAGKPRRNTHQGIAADDDEILIQADNLGGESAAPLIFAMRIRNADNKASRGRGAGIARQGPIRVKPIKRGQAFLQNRAIIGDQANILMAQDNIMATRSADKALNTAEGIPIIRCTIVEIQKFRLFRREATGSKTFHHGAVFGVVGNQGTNAEERPGKGLAGIPRRRREAHVKTILRVAPLRKVIVSWGVA